MSGSGFFKQLSKWTQLSPVNLGFFFNHSSLKSLAVATAMAAFFASIGQKIITKLPTHNYDHLLAWTKNKPGYYLAAVYPIFGVNRCWFLTQAGLSAGAALYAYAKQIPD